MKRFEEQDPWELLGVSPGSKLEEIRHAYDRLSRLLSPGSLALYSVVDMEEQRKLKRHLDRAYMTLLRLSGHAEVLTREAVGITPTTAPTQPSLGTEQTNQNIQQHGVTTSATSPDEQAPPRPPMAKETPAFVLQTRQAEEFTGPLLRQVREALSLSLEEVAKTTRIQPSQITSIENEDFAKLPQQRVFIRGFVVTYARLLTLDPDRVWASYEKRWLKR